MILDIKKKKGLKTIFKINKRKGDYLSILDAIYLGIIEGLTEFIPVSSTGHLIALSKFLGIEQNNVNKAFEIIIQFAAIMALVFVYPSKFTFKHINLWMKIALAFIPLE